MSIVGSAGSPERADRGNAAASGRPVRLGTDLVALVRPAHAIKSIVLVPVALVDTHTWTAAAVTATVQAMLVFVLAASCVYVFNDIVDRGRDRLHPVKCRRPIAAGRVPIGVGVLYCAGLAAALAVAVSAGSGWSLWPVLLYLVLNVAYSRVLKHIAVIDVCTVAAGFVLRVVQGYVVIGVPAPGWLLVAVFSLTLMMSVGKRRQELLETGTVHRPALGGYSLELISHMLQISSVLAVVSGLLHLRSAASFGATAMVFSLPFLVFALFRYLQLALVTGGAGDPLRVLTRDRAIVTAALLWVAALILADTPFLADAMSR